MRKQSFNEGWLYGKQGEDKHPVSLPHDAQIADRRGADSPGGSGHGFFFGGIYEYEKVFDVPEAWKGQAVLLEFEGIYKNSQVYINGRAAGGRPYGYSGFTVAAGDFLKYGQENTIRVVADNSQLPNSRWYTGGGIYRPVWLWLGAAAHIEFEGVRVTTMSCEPARVRVETKISGDENHAAGAAVRTVTTAEEGRTDAANGARAAFDICVEIFKDGRLAASGSGADVTLDIAEAKLWSDMTPELYQCRVTLRHNGTVVDEVTENFGIRVVTWNREGLFVNGRQTLLRGGCIHHDHGILGAATYAKSEERRVRILKQEGFNAIRSSHNPTSKALLDACDKYGMYVMDETFDMWYMHKNKFDYATDFEDWWREDTCAMVRRDYNHPSVILYSICNEVSEPGEARGIDVGKAMVALVHELDHTRPVTGGVNLMIVSRFAKGNGIYKDGEGPEKKMDSGKKGKKDGEVSNGSLLFNTVVSFVGTGMNKAANSKQADLVTTPILDALDIAGYNYASGRYPGEGKLHPDRVIFGSETFPQDIAKNWAMVKKYPYLVGDFMWTAWDYLGEAGIGAWSYTGGMPFNRPYPWLLAGAGVIDILGNPDASCRYAGVVWGQRSDPVIGVRPVNHPGVRVSKSVWRGTNAIESWAWRRCDGNKALVEVFADADTVELTLNGKSLGKKKLKEYKALFKTKYAEGTLTAIAYDANGQESGRSLLESATGKLHVAVVPEENVVSPGDIVYVNVDIVGENGVVESNADAEVHMTVDGGELLAYGSANPCTEERFHTGSYTTWYGRSLAVVRGDAAGTMTVTAECKGKKYSAKMTVR